MIRAALLQSDWLLCRPSCKLVFTFLCVACKTVSGVINLWMLGVVVVVAAVVMLMLTVMTSIKTTLKNDTNVGKNDDHRDDSTQDVMTRRNCRTKTQRQQKGESEQNPGVVDLVGSAPLSQQSKLEILTSKKVHHLAEP